MLFHRLVNAFRKQDWFTVLVETLIVVFGVFIGLQVNNWNTERVDKLAYQDAIHRLAEESQFMLETTNQSRDFIRSMLSDVQLSIEVLRKCEGGVSAEQIVNNGLNIIRSASEAYIVTLSIDQLVTDERLLNVQNSNERVLLRDFHTDLHSISDIKNFVSGSVLSVKNDNHPLIDFTDIIEPEDSNNGVDIRRARINVPVTQACKDLSFVKLFYNWERAHVFQLSLLDYLEETVVNNVNLLNLNVSKQPADTTNQ